MANFLDELTKTVKKAAEAQKAQTNNTPANVWSESLAPKNTGGSGKSSGSGSSGGGTSTKKQNNSFYEDYQARKQQQSRARFTPSTLLGAATKKQSSSFYDDYQARKKQQQSGRFTPSIFNTGSSASRTTTRKFTPSVRRQPTAQDWSESLSPVHMRDMLSAETSAAVKTNVPRARFTSQTNYNAQKANQINSILDEYRLSNDEKMRVKNSRNHGETLSIFLKNRGYDDIDAYKAGYEIDSIYNGNKAPKSRLTYEQEAAYTLKHPYYHDRQSEATDDYLFTDGISQSLRNQIMRNLEGFENMGSVTDPYERKRLQDLDMAYYSATGKHIDVKAEREQASKKVEEIKKYNSYYGRLRQYDKLRNNEDFYSYVKPNDYNSLNGNGIILLPSDMTSDEIQTWSYLKNKEGERKADQYLLDIASVVNKRTYDRMQNQTESEFNNPLAIPANIGASFMTPLSYIDSAAQAASQSFGNDTWRPYNPYSFNNFGVHLQNDIQNAATKDLNGAAKFGVQALMGITENAARIPLGPIGLGMMAAGAGGSAAVNAGMEGQDDARKTFLTGTAYGAIEYITEKIPFENIVKVFKAPPGTVRDGVMTILKNAGIEAGEEGVANLADNIADKIINGDKSQYERYKQQLISSGMDAEKAEKTAFTKFYIYDTLENMGMGAVSGAVLTGSGVGTAAIGNAIDTANTGKEIRDAGAVQDVIDEGKAQGTGTKAYRQAQNMNADTASNFRVGRQANLNAEAMTDEARLAQLINERTGYDVNYRLDMPSWNAGEIRGNDININANKGQRVDTVLHEVGHIDTPEAQAAADKTIEVLQKPEYKAQLDARVNALKQLYEREGKPYTEQMLLNDIAVDMRRGGLLYRTSADYDRATRTDNYNRDRFIPNTVRRAASTVKSVFGGTVTNENAGITVSAKDANTIREAWERADNASAGAYRNATSQSATPTAPLEGSLDGTAYSVETDENGNAYINIDEDILEGVPESEYRRTVRQFIKANFPSIKVNGEDIIVNADARGEFTNSKYSRMLERTDTGAYYDKLRMANNLDEILQNRENIRNSDPKHSRQDIIVDFEEGDVNVKVGTNMYTAKVQIGIRSDGVKVLNDILDIKNTGVVPRVSSFKTNNSGRNQRPVSSTDSITNPDESVKTDYSVDTSEQTRTDIDNEYLDAVNRGDMETAQRLVREQAERNGYSTDTDWRMNHQAPTREYNTPAYDLRRVYGEEIYSPMAARYYGDGAPFDQKAVNVIQSMKDNPEKTVSVYRAVPTSVKDTRLRNGDWVTITEDYAKEHGWRVLDDDYRIIKNEVPAKYLFTNGDSIHEFGYDNGQAEVYRNTENNAKSLDTVTYDDNGNIIPLSQRFNVSNSDTRYSVDTNAVDDLSTEECRKRFADNVDKVFNGEITPRKPIVIGNTPEILQRYGASDAPITINQSTMYKIAYPVGYFGAEDQGHNLGIPALKQLPYQIANPMAIIKSNSQDDSLVILTEWKDTHGNPIIIPLHLGKDGALGVVNEVASAYGKRNIDAILTDTNGNSNVLYTKNDEDIHQLLSNRLQLPVANADDTLIKNSISQNNENVKYSVDTNAESEDAPPVPNEEDNKKVSKLYDNTMQKEMFTDDFKNEAESRIDEFMYEGISNKETYETAKAALEQNGADATAAELATKSGQWTADDTAAALALMAKYQTEGEVKKAVDIAAVLRERMTKAGQAVQALKIVNKLTPEGQFIDFTRQADNMVEEQIEKHPAKDKIRKELKDAEQKDRAKKNGESGTSGAPSPTEAEQGNTTQPQQPRKNTQKTAEKSERDKVLDKWNIEHLSDEDMTQVNDMLKTLDTLDDKDSLIDLILKQSRERKTAAHGIVKKALSGQEVQFLKDTALMQVFGKITDKMPSTFAKKASTYQAISHLLNARTMARNVVSNAAFNTVDRFSTDVGSIADAIIGVFSGKRTVGVDRGVFERGRFRASLDRATKKYIDIALAVDHDADTGKYNLSSANRTFKGRALGGLERAMSYGLQVTDEWSKGGIEYNTRKGLERLKKSGYTDEEINDIAEFEAKYRTFQDDTKLSQVLAGLKDAMNVIGIGDTKKLGRLKSHEFGLGDLVQKYTQVPGALITRSVEYSPLGYCKALYGIGKAAYAKARGANFSASAQRNIALSLGRAMTGTGLIALFAALSGAGIFTGEREDEDDKVKALENAEGIGNMQLNLSALKRLIESGGKDTSGRKNGDILTTVGFLEPLNTLMAMGTTLAEYEGGGKNMFNWAKAAGAKTFDQITDMSTMSTIRDIMNTITYGGDGSDVAIGFLSNNASGFVPSPVRQLGNFLDTTQRNPYNEENSFDKAREKFRASIPWAREGVAAKINPYGEEKTTSSGNRVIDFINSFLSPGDIDIYQTSDISEELYRLSETSTDVLPHVPAKSFTVDKVKFKPRGKDYERFSRMVGTITADKMRDIINGADYANMSDEERIEALSKAAKDGEKEAKEMFAGNKPLNDEQKQEQDVYDKEDFRLDEWEKENSINKQSGKQYVKYGHDTYELTNEQKTKYIYDIETRTNQYNSELINGSKKIEDIIPEPNFMLYADEMTPEQYEAKLAACKDNESREKFINGESQKKVSVTGNYSDWGERVQKKILNKVASTVKKDVETEMEADIKENGKLYYKDPSHARDKTAEETTTETPTETNAAVSDVKTVSRANTSRSGGGSSRSTSRSGGSSSGTSRVKFTARGGSSGGGTSSGSATRLKFTPSSTSGGTAQLTPTASVASAQRFIPSTRETARQMRFIPRTENAVKPKAVKAIQPMQMI